MAPTLIEQAQGYAQDMAGLLTRVLLEPDVTVVAPAAVPATRVRPW